MSSRVYAVGTEVTTHSLSAAEYNGLCGEVIGQPVENNGVTRVPVRATLSGGTQKVMMLKPENLLLVAPSSTTDLALQRQLMKAIYIGEVQNIRKCVNVLGADVNALDKNACSPLYLAAMMGQIDAMKALLKLGADVNTDKNGRSPLIGAATTTAENSREEAIRVLAANGADVNVPDTNGFTPVYVVAEKGFTAAIRVLAELGADVNVASNARHSPVFVAAENGHVGAIRVLVEFGADIDALGFDGFSPLFVAALKGQTRAIRVLVELGADVNLQCKCDATHMAAPLSAATQEGKVDAIRVLVELGADINASDSDGFSPVALAAQYGHVAAIRVLAELGADLNAVGTSGETPMMVSAQNGNVDAIRVLAELGVDVITPDTLGFTPLFAAAQNAHADSVRVLAKLGGDVNTPNHKGSTPVALAAYNGHVDVIKLLYKLGADMDPVCFSYPINAVAQANNQTEAVQLINKILSKLTRECEGCGCSSRRLKVCSRCGNVRYCSVECQKQDHKKHKRECRSRGSASGGN
jgi:ankyrin repeat protein